jgi:hypothetical protein
MEKSLATASSFVSDECHARLQGVLVDGAILHDDEEVLSRVCDQVEVCRRVAVDKQKVGKPPYAEPAGIGIARARNPEVGRLSPLP